MWYRKDLLEKYNLDVPTTWDEFNAAATTITQGENGEVYGCSVPMGTNDMYATCFLDAVSYTHLEQLTVRLRTRRSHILRWAVGALDWYHSIWFLNRSLDDYFNRADCDPDLLPALRAFGKPLRAVCLLRTEQLQTTQVCMFGGVEKPSSLADWASDRPICLHCTIYCLFHAYLSFLIPCLTSILYADNPLLEQICLERLRQTRPRSGGACSRGYGIDDSFII